MSRRFQFDFDKALEAILYIAKRIPDPTFHKISKIFYLADLAHLEKYGRFIAGDRYIAMEYGPVPSETNNIMRAARGEDQQRANKEIIENAFEVEGNHKVKPLREARPSVFSRSDLECLDVSITTYGRKSFGYLTDKTHDAAWKATADGQEMRLEVIISMFKDAEALREHLEIG
jgi:hypothetical protein